MVPLGYIAGTVPVGETDTITGYQTIINLLLAYTQRLPVRVFSAATTQVDQTVVDAGCSKDAGPCIHQQSTRLL